MIFGNLKYADKYDFLTEKIKACFTYAKEHDLTTYEKGSYKINGDEFFVNIENYATVKREERFWEAHKKYIDVHMIIEGKESIDVSFCDDMQIKSFDENRDFVELIGEEKATVNLINKGDFLICYPEDAHRTAIICQQSQTIKKLSLKLNYKKKIACLG